MSRFLFTLLLLLALPAWAVPIRVEATADLADDASPREILIRAVPQQAARGAGLPSAVTTTVRLPGAAVLDLSEGVVWRIEGLAEGLWSEPRWLAPGPGNPAPSTQVRFYRSGSIEGAIEPATKLESIGIRFNSSSGASPAFGRTMVDCPVRENRFLCDLPAGLLDVRLQAHGSIPIYRWGVKVDAGKASDLGKLGFRPGASVVGWVQTGAAKAPDGSCRVRLSPRSYGPENEPALRALSREVQANERGFFQFEDVPPGVYEASAQMAGMAPVRFKPVEVIEGLETEVRAALVLVPPVPVRLELYPDLDPYGSVWTVQLQQIEETTQASGELYQGPASSEGIWERSGLASGKYRLLVLGARGSRWVHEILDIGPGQGPVHIPIPVLRVRGRVLLGDEPLAGATLWFGGRFGPRNVRFESDESGRFEGVLPEEGTWKVDLVAEQKGLRLPLPPVEVRKSPGASYARVEIVLPDTHLHGDVVDEEGRPVPDAAVEVIVPRKVSRTRTDDEGKFEFRGLVEGSVKVAAEAGKRTSDSIQAEVKEGKDSPPLRLVVREMLTLQGQVLSARGPVPGARIEAWPGLDQSDGGTAQQAVSGPAGEFSLSLPASTRSLYVVVAAPGHALRIFRADCDPKRPFDITLESFGGTLVLDAGDQAADAFLVHGGAFVSLSQAAFWAGVQDGRSEGSRLSLPSVEVGDYWFCRGPEATIAARQGQPLPLSSCSQGYLAPLQELILDVPKAEPAQR